MRHYLLYILDVLYDTLQYKYQALQDTRTQIQNKSPAKSQTNYAAHAAHCAIYERTAVGWAGAAVGADPPDTTITQQITQYHITTQHSIITK